ncbi:MAG: c-type cytochrome [Mariprofundaceae bacterium]|nr:c-type cytochrome [Mariprofundaceae bacterium]
MKRLMMLSAAALLSVAWMTPSAMAGGVAEIGDAGKGRVIFNKGLGDDVPACATCHGKGGMGADEMGTPRLAYQVQKYVWKQLEDFATDKRIDNVMYQMNDIAKALTAEQRRDVAAYVHTLKTPFMGSDLDQMRKDDEEIGVVHKGQIIVEFGIPSRGIPACMSCHAFHGRAAGNIYPAIGGQRYVYLKHELEAFRLGHSTPSSEDEMARDNDLMGQMRNVATKLKDEDIANVAAFLTVARPATAGNPSAPRR